MSTPPHSHTPHVTTAEADHATEARAMPDAMSSRRARAAWSLIAEPSDAVAVRARSILGIEGALDAAREATPGELLRALGGDVPSDPAESGSRDPLARMERALTRWRTRLASRSVDEVIEKAQRRGIGLLTPQDAAWPQALAHLGETAPVCLWWLGALEALDGLDHATARAVAIVGCRASSRYGDDTAADLAADIAETGELVISGGAYGIDAAAHRGALSVGPCTHAVLAGGLDRLYPRGNTALLEAIAEGGLLLAEAPPGTEPTRWRFLSRNRLIAALSAVTVVVQAGWRSGALSTARHAEELSRTVAAVPGPVTAPESQGCHRLIRERGAVLVGDAEDVLELVPGRGPREEQCVQDDLDLLTPADRRIFDAVPPRSTGTAEAISVSTGEGIGAVRSALARMELLGIVEMTARGVRRARARR